MSANPTGRTAVRPYETGLSLVRRPNCPRTYKFALSLTDTTGNEIVDVVQV